MSKESSLVSEFSVCAIENNNVVQAHFSSLFKVGKKVFLLSE